VRSGSRLRGPVPVRSSILIGGLVLFMIVLVVGILKFSGLAPNRHGLATGNAKSIAVLPFENLSHDPENAYFADGIQEEILNRLSRIGDLKVISRTSTQRYKSNPSDLTEIANQLGVAHILEGTVQKAADQVRVNVQLINARTDSHVWAEKFDRNLADIFAVESEIATKIAETLEAKLTGVAQKAITARPTNNIEAHQLYLKGRYFLSKRTGGRIEEEHRMFQSGDREGLRLCSGLFGVGRLEHVSATGRFLARAPSKRDLRESKGSGDESFGA
jgi:TolB-like protein